MSLRARCALALALVVIPAAAHAEPMAPQELSMGTVLAATVRQNPDLQRASVDIDRANAAAFGAAGIDDWLLKAAVGIYRERNKAVAGNVIGTNQADIYSVSTELSRLLSTGGSIGVSLSGRRRNTIFAAAGDRETTDNNASLALNFDQPLLRGRGAQVARGNVRQARLGADAATLDREAQVRNLLLQVIHSYWDVALIWEDLGIRKAALALAQERRRITDAAIDAGTVAPTEALAVEQIINTREEEILSAELTITQRSLDLRRLAFLEVGPTTVDVQTTAVVQARGRDFDEEELMRRALETSPEIAALGKRGAGATIEVEVTENGMLPRLDFSLSVGPQGTAPTAPDAIDGLVRATGYSINAGLSYEQRLANRSARGTAEQARAQLRRIHIDMEEAKRQVALSTARAVRLARSAQRRMELGERTIALAERNIEAEMARFELGRATNFDVLQRQDELKQARLRFASATVDFLKAEATIDSLTGDLLEKYGVRVARD